MNRRNAINHLLTPRKCAHLLPSDPRTSCDRCRRVDATFTDLAAAFAAGLAIWSLFALVFALTHPL